MLGSARNNFVWIRTEPVLLSSTLGSSTSSLSPASPLYSSHSTPTTGSSQTTSFEKMQMIWSTVVAGLNFWFLSTRNQLNSYTWSVSWLWKNSKYTFHSLKNDSMSTFLKRQSKQKYFEMIERYIGVNRLLKRKSFSFISWIILSIKHWLNARF